jgi:hypothetical protein
MIKITYSHGPEPVEFAAKLILLAGHSELNFHGHVRQVSAAPAAPAQRD